MAFTVILLAAILAIVLLRRREQRDLREPPFIPSTIPYVGHAFGLLRYGVSYFVLLRSKIRYPIYTINLMSQKSYIINDPDLISLVQRESKKISNNGPFVETVFKRMLGNDDASMGIILSNMNGDGSAPSYRKDMKVAEHEALAPGETMAQLYTDSMDEVAKEIYTLTVQGPKGVNLMSWLKEVYTLSTASALYGPQNPFKSSEELVQAFWDYDSGLKMLVLDLFPAITIPKALKGREKVVQALRQFFKENVNGRDGYAEIVRNRLNANAKHACSEDSNARSELGLLSGLLINTVPVTFWMLAHILSSESLYSAIMSEISNVVKAGDASEAHFRYIDVLAIKERCPILISTYREVLRVAGAATATLSVEEDTLLDKRYLLKKGSIVQIPTNSVHADTEVWGSDAGDFNPERFDQSRKSFKKHHPSAFRTFGGGVGLCPGRRLAMDEITTFTALVLYTFDISPGGSASSFQLPQKNTASLGSIMNPIGSFDVTLSCREGLKGVFWKFGAKDQIT